MPEAAIDENNLPLNYEHKIGRYRWVAPMQPDAYRTRSSGCVSFSLIARMMAEHFGSTEVTITSTLQERL